MGFYDWGILLGILASVATIVGWLWRMQIRINHLRHRDKEGRLMQFMFHRYVDDLPGAELRLCYQDIGNVIWQSPRYEAKDEKQYLEECRYVVNQMMKSLAKVNSELTDIVREL